MAYSNNALQNIEHNKNINRLFPLECKREERDCVETTTSNLYSGYFIVDIELY